ncbi:hypothetical protein L207DRAFT_509415 [Hyaloscypha variabilis F]|uniref:Uncharacterized protein n=1 Tax=Hyaloscypha variabilis (strain UAMH 11265 / GT02V1 / F) TaxID=1149755 RepID=A0A2J6S1S9_HYAVF|nr:hypothetical protein L207DRAFT_509415 [Hyaloscypha variabilis F]
MALAASKPTSPLKPTIIINQSCPPPRSPKNQGSGTGPKKKAPSDVGVLPQCPAPLHSTLLTSKFPLDAPASRLWFFSES